jgi:DNA/RNA endonuclease G (NUC1)
MYHYKAILASICIIFSTLISAQEDDLRIVDVKTDIYEITYSQTYQQPLTIKYVVQCPTGKESRTGMSFKKYPGIITSNDSDYVDNVWDRGHMAPAGAFTCDANKLKATFSYLNCALQHQSLNRGPWKELERFEKNLTKVYAFVNIEIRVHFENDQSNWLKTGALVPVGFTKIIWCDGEIFKFYFPNKDVAGHDWIEYKVN